MSNFRLAPASADGQVDCRYDLITPVQVSGKLDDPRIQRALAGAIVGEENPGVRLRAVNAVAGRRLAGADREIRAALILALTSDPNPGVRMEALRALRRLPLADDIKSALLTTLLTDRNSGLRIAAINGLDSSFTAPLQIDPDVLSALRVTAARDDNNYIRQKSRTVLEEVRNP
jgi:HEAT repeat protein